MSAQAFIKFVDLVVIYDCEELQPVLRFDGPTFRDGIVVNKQALLDSVGDYGRLVNENDSKYPILILDSDRLTRKPPREPLIRDGIEYWNLT